MPLQKPLPNWTARITVVLIWGAAVGSMFPIIWIAAALNVPEWLLRAILTIWVILPLSASLWVLCVWWPTAGKRVIDALSKWPWTF